MNSVDLVKMLNLPVLLIIGLELGCINHALLSCEAMMSDKINLIGCLTNGPLTALEAEAEVIEILNHNLPVALLGHIPNAGESSIDRQLTDRQLMDIFTVL